MTSHTINKAVLAKGEALLAADCDRVGSAEVLGLDETLLGHEGRWRGRWWRTLIGHMTGGDITPLQVVRLGLPRSVGVCGVEVERGVGP